MLEVNANKGEKTAFKLKTKLFSEPILKLR